MAALADPVLAVLKKRGRTPTHPSLLGCALAFCDGTFLCIACADLLPELQFRAHDRFKLSLALLVGLAVAVAITRFGHTSHEHELERPIANAALYLNQETARVQPVAW